ncbi:hypothetical protein KQX54_017918 [Cotesia glomerata]|uniref:Uncharacterized protein n=1 Tax=Cotesia glomerata TaxID=32391 RepID=A0AAV7IWM9_COTGL|nr:hypothetical protein KQX54_017918 [Cotesia glomerata]
MSGCSVLEHGTTNSHRPFHPPLGRVFKVTSRVFSEHPTECTLSFSSPLVVLTPPGPGCQEEASRPPLPSSGERSLSSSFTLESPPRATRHPPALEHAHPSLFKTTHELCVEPTSLQEGSQFPRLILRLISEIHRALLESLLGRKELVLLLGNLYGFWAVGFRVRN